MRQSTNRSRNRLHDLPIATILIIAANVIVSLYARYNFADFASDYGLTPSNLRSGSLITASLIHDGYFHLITNMLLLYIFGSGMERAMGKLEFSLFYIGACLASAMMHVAIVYAALPQYYIEQTVVGASGAIAGVMGLYAVRYHRKIFKWAGVEVSALLVIMVWLLVQVVLGTTALYTETLLGFKLRYVAYWSHLGGFAFGIFTAIAANMALQGEREHLTAEGNANSAQGNLLEAAQCYESLLKYDPDYALAHAELGRLWAIMEDDEQSVPYYRNAVKLYLREGREDMAIRAAVEMRRYWPEFNLSPGERFRMGSFLEEIGRIERAISVFQEIAENSPLSDEAQMALVKIAQLQLTSQNDPEAAIRTLEGFLQRYPNSEWRLFGEQLMERAQEKAADNEQKPQSTRVD